MKIGEFACKYNISIDTVRHYIEMGLLFPVKSPAGFYQFGQGCERNLERILKLKQMKFSLDEIKKILSYEDLAGTEYEENSNYIRLFKQKKLQIDENIKKLMKAKSMLEEAYVKDESKILPDPKVFGIGIKDIQILSCPVCGSDFNIRKADIKDNKLVSGELSCGCGFSMRITDGIVIADEGFIDLAEDTLDIGSYIDNTHPGFIENIQRSISWFKNEIDFDSFSGKTIIELGSGSGFFLRSIYENLPDDCMYMAVDNNINRHYELKEMLEKFHISKNIVFICCDFMQIPVKKHSAQIIMDFSGSTNYAFNNEDFLINKLKDLYSSDAVLFGSYFVFDNFKARSIIKDEYKKNFQRKNILKSFNNAGFSLLNSHESSPLKEGGIYEDFFVKGEIVRSFLYHGKL